MKKKIVFYALLCLILQGCADSPIENPPINNENGGSEIGTEEGGEEVVQTYKGIALPAAECGGEKMRAIIELIATQEGEIDDQKLLAKLGKNKLRCTERFAYSAEDVMGIHDCWVDMQTIDGRPVLGSVFLKCSQTSSGAQYSFHNFAGFSNPDDAEFFCSKGYEGYFTQNHWRYSNSSNVLVTNMDGKLGLSAEVLYFDDNVVVLDGHLEGIAWMNGPTKTLFDNELYLLEFEPFDSDDIRDGNMTQEEFEAYQRQLQHKQNNTLFTEYGGVELPEWLWGGEIMNDYLLMAKEKGGNIDDAAFVEAMNTKAFHCSERFMLDLRNLPTNNDKDDEWTWGDGWVGRQVCGTLYPQGAGSFYTPHYLACGLFDAEAYLNSLGYVGWYVDGSWSYDADTDTLTTSQMENGSLVEVSAKVLYFDGQFAILDGLVSGIAWDAPRFPRDLYYFEFTPTDPSYKSKLCTVELIHQVIEMYPY